MELPNLFGINPDYLTGLLGAEGANKLQQRANTTGLINMAVGYLAQPKNQNFGSALPYLARSYIAGQSGAQQTVDDTIRQLAIQEQTNAQRLLAQQRQREQERELMQQQQMQNYAAGIQDPTERQYALSAPKEYFKTKFESKTANSPFAKVDPKDYTPESIAMFAQTNRYEDLIPVAKPATTDDIKNFEYAVSKGYNKSFEEFRREVDAYKLAQLGISAEQLRLQQRESEYNYGAPQPTARTQPVIKSATMQDIQDTAKATRKTTAEVTADLRKRGIKIQGER